MMNFDDFERPLDPDAEQLALKMQAFLKSKNGNLLQPVRLKGKKETYYWSFMNKKHELLHPRSEMYLLPWQMTEKKEYYVYTPYKFNSGNVFLVPREQIIDLGFN
jgi:hypothetical protein